jgi:predicted RNA-binding protein with PIN domain
VSWDQADAFMSIPVKDRTPEASYSHRTYHVGEDELKAIIASESGHNRNPNKQMRQTPEPEKQRPGKPRPVLPECLIVDGYNLLHLSDIDTTDMSYARERLIDDLAAYQAYADKKVIAVFDGYRKQDNEGSSYKTGGLEVVYTRTGQTADAYIEKLVHDLKQSYAITVATSDALIQNSIFAQGAMRISSRILRQEIDQAKKLFLPENSRL